MASRRRARKGVKIIRAGEPLRYEARQRRTGGQYYDEAHRLHGHHERQVDLAGGANDGDGVHAAWRGGKIGGERVDAGDADQDEGERAANSDQDED